MILGIGSDVVSCERIEKLYKKEGARFLSRILSVRESEKFIQIADSKKKISYLAKRFAAKEAVAKALGIGIGRGLSFVDIEILNDELGSPKVYINHRPNMNIENLKISLSLSDEWPIALAFVIISR